ncbi:response regulator [Robertkochia marina]|uniref:histidine kinase n=1 Tax=Robertkochia marina TaxID=1227945 RepID=A0A4V6RRS3_9FLAO|nr:response regulator [Robertkochia marina]THD66354.1 response regulator [Robertkochia marina]TRZ44035.1 response regulator [Robertkochia marina]
MRYIILVIAFLLLPCNLVAQDDVIIKDSLQGIVKKFYKEKNLGDYEGALDELNRAFQLATILDDDRINIDLYNLNTILNLEFNQQNSPKLSLRLAQSDFFDSDSYPEGKASSTILQAYVNARKRMTEEALEDIRRADAILEDIDPELLSENTKQLINFYKALTYKELDDYNNAKVYFNEVMQNDHRFENEYLRAKAYLNMADIFLDEYNFASAEYQLKNALLVAGQYEYPKILKDAHYLYSQLQEKQGDWREAFYHSKSADSINTLYFNPETLLAQGKASRENVTDIYIKTIDYLTKDNEEKDEVTNRSKLTSVLSSALLIIISLLTISLYRNNQIKIKTNELLVKKNKELRIAKENAEQAMKTKSQFLSTVSHELRTPLYAVTGLTHLLLEEDPKENQKPHLESLKFSGEYLLDFINDILQINKIDANKVAVEHQQFDLRKTLHDVCHSLDQTAKENNNNILVEIAPDIPNKLLGDPLKLSQIFINLVGNALKFTQSGNVTIIARPIEKDQGNMRIHFEVVDEGIGISKEMQENIFDSFSQGSVQINRKYGGTGLGLTIVKSLLGLFNSNIQLESELGKGSRFFFDIVFDIPETEPVTIEGEQEILPTEKDLESILANLHILIVEDNKINQVITKKMLDKKEITSDIANDGYEAIDKVKANEYDLVLMDIHMPGISGLAATEQIRTFNTTLPIVALTAITLDENTDDFFKAGCTDIITKPFKPETFYGTIAKVIRNSKESVKDS